ncbi:MAG: acyl--CoA ligase, partial [Actinobacteria bacterium]|nr:acyl--CoA ligase [Actinomycetota bacterium]
MTAAEPLHDVTLNLWEPTWAARKAVLVRHGGRLNYANFIDNVCALYGQRTAFVLDRVLDLPGFKGHVLSFDDVRALVDRMAYALRALGVQRGDRVGLVTLNRIEMAFCNFAAAKIGAIPVPMNFMLRGNEIEHIVQRAGIELLVCDPGVFGMSIKDTSAVPSVKKWAMVGEHVQDGMASIPALMAEANGPVETVLPASRDDVAVLFFTSGTTGFPKGAMLSHENVMIYVDVHVRWAARLQPKMPKSLNRLAMLVMPVAAAAGYQQLLLNMGFGTPVYFSSRFDTEDIFE